MNAFRAATAGTRLTVVGLAVLVLLGIVAFVSRGHITPAASGTHARSASQTFANVVFTLWLVAMAGGLVLVVYLHTLKRQQSATHHANYRRLALGMAAFGAVLAVVLLAVRLFGVHALHRRSSPVSSQSSSLNGKKGKQGALQRPAAPSFEWQLALGIVALVTGIALTALIRVYRRRNETFRDYALQQELGALLDETLDDLRNEKDPRRAVIAAYARMETTLGAHGLPRRPSEAPREYLSRVLVDLHVTEPAVRSLTRLFQRAKFSPHEIGPEMKEEAIEALVALRTDVRAIDIPREAPPPRLEEAPRPVA